MAAPARPICVWRAAWSRPGFPLEGSWVYRQLRPPASPAGPSPCLGQPLTEGALESPVSSLWLFLWSVLSPDRTLFCRSLQPGQAHPGARGSRRSPISGSRGCTRLHVPIVPWEAVQVAPTFCLF